MLALARRLTDESQGADHSLEALFAQQRKAEAEYACRLRGEHWIDAAPTPETPSSDGDVVGQSECAHGRRPSLADGMRKKAESGVPTQAVSFEELARLVRRPLSRRKSVPTGQLTLFSD